MCGRFTNRSYRLTRRDALYIGADRRVRPLLPNGRNDNKRNVAP